VTVALMVRLGGQGLGPAALGGLVALAQVPWTLKPFVGPLVDRLPSRRPLVLGAEAGMAASLVALAVLAPGSALFPLLLVAHNAFSAVQDVATDALALDLLPAAERGRANGIMSAGKWLGTLVGGPGLAWLASAAGWSAACAAAVLFLLLPAGLVLRVKESIRTERPALVREALRSFGSRVALVTLLFLLLSGAGDQLLYPVIIPLLRVRLHLSDDRLPLVFLVAGATAAAGSLAGGRLADALGRRRTIALAALTVAAAHLAWAAASPFWDRFPVLLAYEVVASVAGGALASATLALCMDLTNPRLAATQFQVFMALVNVRGAWAAAAGGQFGQRVPAPVSFVAAAVVELLALLLLPWLVSERAIIEEK
jgi:PAT family beta-lactamase induction signal transducer AmpG